MKRLLSLLFFIFLITDLLAQEDKYLQCTYTYFKDSKKIATSQCFDKDKRWGQARAFTKEGKVIFEKQLRTIGGHSSVTFSFHPNGAVSKAEWSSAPDGGIQWHKSKDEFSLSGELTNHWELNNDDLRGTHVTVTAPDTSKKYKLASTENKEKDTARIVQETVRCAEIYVSEFWFINHTKKSLNITVESKSDKGEKYSLLVAPNDTVKGGQKILAEQYEEPLKYFNISITRGKKKPKHELKISPIKDGVITARKGLRKYYFEVH